MSEAMTETTEAKPLGYLNYRCPHCKGDRCGTDANAGWDVVTQQSALLSEFDDQWCNDCGEVTLEEFTVTDPTEIARIDAERARLKVMAAGETLLHAVRHALQILSDPAGLSPENQDELRSMLVATVVLAQGERAPMTVESMLVLSTGHLQHDTCTIWLDTAPFAAFTKADIGWFVFVPEDLGKIPCRRTCSSVANLRVLGAASGSCLTVMHPPSTPYPSTTGRPRRAAPKKERGKEERAIPLVAKVLPCSPTANVSPSFPAAFTLSRPRATPMMRPRLMSRSNPATR
jgi:hypothetical protein